MRRFGLIALGVLALLGALVASRLRFVSGGSTPAPVATSEAADTGLLTVPIAGYDRRLIQNNWGDPRDGGVRRHEGIDIIVAGGSSVVAAGPGTVEKLFESKLGGTTLYERSADGRWIYYYAHLAGYAPGVHEGQAVRAGDPLGFVGDTGDAGAGNYHLHFGMQRTAAGQGWWQGEAVNPYPMLTGKR